MRVLVLEGFWDRRTPWVLMGFCCLFAGFDVLSCGTFRRQFEKVLPGWTEAQVLALLGAPDRNVDEFELGQYDGFEEEYARSERSGSDRWLVWYKGIDLVFTVGLDGEGKVTMKAFGGT